MQVRLLSPAFTAFLRQPGIPISQAPPTSFERASGLPFTRLRLVAIAARLVAMILQTPMPHHGAAAEGGREIFFGFIATARNERANPLPQRGAMTSTSLRNVPVVRAEQAGRAGLWRRGIFI